MIVVISIRYRRYILEAKVQWQVPLEFWSFGIYGCVPEPTTGLRRAAPGCAGLRWAAHVRRYGTTMKDPSVSSVARDGVIARLIIGHRSRCDKQDGRGVRRRGERDRLQNETAVTVTEDDDDDDDDRACSFLVALARGPCHPPYRCDKDDNVLDETTVDFA
ncbi:Immunoglobulin lambda variable 5-39 [Frankliniella fusca]|uniref:Immunoglobulin lambda variable 5-39 n=1 Tax=Frankliniella fusca TaxID=407009 RepID=A0AAE1LLK3_9NEOP|nr:Immunoglobulin lambda variable 5-39 [Frankliniella fusca]